jgi:hypothetical protein
VETADLTDDQIRTRLKLLTAEAQKRQVQVENWLPGVHPELTLAEQQKADKARNTKAERRLGRIYEGLVKEVGGYGWIYGFVTASGVLDFLSTWFAPGLVSQDAYVLSCVERMRAISCFWVSVTK